MRAGLLLVGGVVGVLVVRYLLLDQVEVLGWRIFWSQLGEGNLMNVDTVFNSGTFWKCVAGYLVGGGAGWIFGSRALRRAEDRHEQGDAG